MDANPKIEVGQWWETKHGERVLITGINCRWYSTDGSYLAGQVMDEDLGTLFPAECDSFAWEPGQSTEWRDARPEDADPNGVKARFRDNATHSWEHGLLIKWHPQIESAWRCRNTGYHKYCQVLVHSS